MRTISTENISPDVKLKDGSTNFKLDLTSHTNYFPFGMEWLDYWNWSNNSNFFADKSHRYGFGSHEKDNEVKGEGNHYSFGNYGLDPRIARRWNIDPIVKHWESGFVVFANNPLLFADPDGMDVIPTNDLNSNSSLKNIVTLASQNSVFKNVMKAFYANQNHVYIHVKQLKDSKGNPKGISNTAKAESNLYKKNPVARYGIHRIVINSELLSSDQVLRIDKTFVFRALLHEGIHVRYYERYKQNPDLREYPGHKDFLTRGIPIEERHHNQMGEFNRQELIEGMKEFDNQLRNAGETVPSYHTNDWYEAMSWYGLTRTQSWTDFAKNNPMKAKKVIFLLYQQLQRNIKAKNTTKKAKGSK